MKSSREMQNPEKLNMKAMKTKKGSILGIADGLGGLIGMVLWCGQADKSINHEEHEGHEELMGANLALGGVVPAQAGAQRHCR